MLSFNSAFSLSSFSPPLADPDAPQAGGTIVKVWLRPEGAHMHGGYLQKLGDFAVVISKEYKFIFFVM